MAASQNGSGSIGALIEAAEAAGTGVDQPWLDLFTAAQKLPADQARPAYERLVVAFPTAAWIWGAYISHEDRDGNERETKGLLSRALKLPDPSLWAIYTSWVVKRQYGKAAAAATAAIAKHGASGGGEGAAADEVKAAMAGLHPARKQVVDAFELALGRVGFLPGAEPLWQGYIAFLSEPAPREQEQEAGRRRDVLRSVYKRALQQPLACTDALWTAYRQFEQGQGQQELASQLIAQWEPIQQRSSQAAHARQEVWARIRRDVLPVPPPRANVPASPSGAELASQVDQWRALVDLMAANQTLLPAEKVTAHVRLLYHLWRTSHWHFWEPWYDLAVFESKQPDGWKNAISVIRSGLVAIKDSQLFCLTAADLLEAAEAPEATQCARECYQHAARHCSGPLVSISFMRFERRTSGVEAARAAFRQARREEGCTAEVYIAAAQLERAGGAADVAETVLQLGRRRFPDHVGLAQFYARFLLHQSGTAAVRALMEAYVKVVPAEKARPLWDLYLDMELNWAAHEPGSRANLADVEERRAAALNETVASAAVSGRTGTQHPLQAHLHRYRVFGLAPSGPADAEFLVRRHPQAAHVVFGSDGSASSGVPPVGPRPLKSDRRLAAPAHQAGTGGSAQAAPRPLLPSTAAPSLLGGPAPAQAPAVAASQAPPAPNTSGAASSGMPSSAGSLGAQLGVSIGPSSSAAIDDLLRRAQAGVALPVASSGRAVQLVQALAELPGGDVAGAKRVFHAPGHAAEAATAQRRRL